MRGLSLVTASGGHSSSRCAGLSLSQPARASHCRSLSGCGAQAPEAQAQQLWLTGLAAPRPVGSSQTGAQTRVPCIGRQTLNHCATREAPKEILKDLSKGKDILCSYIRHNIDNTDQIDLQINCNPYQNSS